jgi:7,8-dihydropterin-6-yl-methyl-4-(beta-D-ribofuranosyl)aminobenzene 5'-phosphate synthase
MKKTLLFLAGILLIGGICENAFGSKDEIKVTILYDNIQAVDGLEADWGFACLVEGLEKTILFDAGTKDKIFARNVATLKVNLSEVDLAVISHEHGDHTGGLPTVFEATTNLPVYHPVSFSQAFRDSVKEAGGESVPVTGPVAICRDVYLTGEMGGAIKEQSLILRTARGLVVITGCSHPGIVTILEKTKEILDEDIYVAFGGFHLGKRSPAEMNEIIKRFRQLGVRKCGAAHCTGEEQIEQFRKAYGEDFVSIGVGKVLSFNRAQ